MQQCSFQKVWKILLLKLIFLIQDKPSPPPTDTCESPDYSGDDYCDDENNNAGCDYDGGDCCGDEINTSYCFVCECFEGSTAAPTTSTPTTEVCSYSL